VRIEEFIYAMKNVFVVVATEGDLGTGVMGEAPQGWALLGTLGAVGCGGPAKAM
jgi:hypothetical protein